MSTAIIFRERILEPSETFILEQAKALDTFRPVLAGLRRPARALHHSLPEVLFRNGSGSLDKAAIRAYRMLPVRSGFVRRLRKESPAIVHAHFAMDGVQALPIARALDVPLVVSLHGFDVTSSDEALRASSSGRHYVTNRARLFRDASAFLCVSSFVREAALRAGFPAEKLRVHYSGVDCERFCPTGVEHNRKLVLFVGRLVEKKGCEYAIRAMALVQKKVPEAQLEIIGDGPLRAELEALAAQLGVRVVFRGTQPPREVQRRMSEAWILCNPSVTAKTGDMEGFGMVFAEAQGLGTPVVSTLHGPIPEAIHDGHTGFLCPERASEPLAQAMLRLLADPNLWGQMSENAVAWVRGNFDIDRQTAKLEGFYKECIERHPCKQELSGAAFQGAVQSPVRR